MFGYPPTALYANTNPYDENMMRLLQGQIGIPTYSLPPPALMMDQTLISSDFCYDPLIKVSLEDEHLWNRFYSMETEMIITKPGRRLFPVFKVGISGLNPDKKYICLLEICLASENRYKYQLGKWIAIGKSEPLPRRANTVYRHPDSPSKGSHWMSQPVSFSKVKITNCGSHGSSEHILLNSMHKYIPRLRIYAQEGDNVIPIAAVSFPNTVFMAVTAYQSEDITKLKVNNNPFAKSFRDTNKPRKDNKTLKSKRSESPSDSDNDSSDSVKKTKLSDSEEQMEPSDNKPAPTEREPYLHVQPNPQRYSPLAYRLPTEGSLPIDTRYIPRNNYYPYPLNWVYLSQINHLQYPTIDYNPYFTQPVAPFPSMWNQLNLNRPN